MRSSITATLFVSCATLAAPVLAGPIEPNWVAPDATWIVHADLEAMHASTIGREAFRHVRAALQEEDLMEAKFVAALLNEVKGVTIYGTTDDEEDGIVIVSASKNLDEAINALPAVAAEYRKITEKDRTFHAFKEGGEEWLVYQRPDPDPERRVVLLARKMDRLAQGIAAIEAGAKAPAAPLREAPPRAGTAFFVSATKLPGLDDEDDPPARILQNAKGIRLEAGENAGQVFFSLRLDTDSRQEAADTAQVVQGFVALGRLAAGSDPVLQSLNDLLNAVKIGATEHGMTLDFSFDAARLRDLAEDKIGAFIDADEEGVSIGAGTRRAPGRGPAPDEADDDDEPNKGQAPAKSDPPRHEQPAKEKAPGA